MTDRAKVAAHFHRMQCEDDRFGYTQGSGRWGSGPTEEWEYEGVKGMFVVGDRDCSSSVIDCWQEALRGSEYEGALADATYTGNMREVFVGSGLFEWKPMSFTAQTGDVYLNESQHTAMCQSAVPDVLSEFYINEHGEIIGGEVGKQAYWEAMVRNYYDFPWDGILHYNGKADIDMKPVDVWAYTNPSEKIDAYQALMETHRAVTGGGISSWAYRNPSETIDAYKALMDVHAEVEDVKQAIDNLVIGKVDIDYDKLAEVIADKFADRMKD